ncbi:hypothetical protein MMC25_004307 [Agyrium rufum]|nr:hypothetical protein [Agyrium rufum]
MATEREYKHLTNEQVDHFMRHGFVRLEECFTPEKAAKFTGTVWKRLGMDPNDKSTWTEERINMPTHNKEHCSTFAPKAWAAMCELLGGEDRVEPESANWNDGLIVNFGTPEWEGRWPHPSDLTNWHVDGDFFVHYLDSREQGLLVIPLFTDIVEHAGGTMICSDAIPHMAKHLYEHPEGVSPRMVPRGQEPKFDGLGFYFDIVKKCSEFHEMTGNTGDVVLMHPLMVHSASKNSLRRHRMITNPPVSLKQPFNFDRDDPKDYSLVELKTLDAIGKDRLRGWKTTAPRESIVPERLKLQNKRKVQEEARLKAEGIKVTQMEVAAH